MKNSDQLKSEVREKYAEIALQNKDNNASSCCGAGPVSKEVYTIMSDSYTHLEGYHPDADLGLGCGLPTQFAQIRPGDTVVDLGSGAGNDCFIARAETGETGRVIGIDFTPEMVAKAKVNATSRGLSNVEFYQGDIEELPLEDNLADVIVSNCVLNLVPNKAKVFQEIQRVLKPGGHFSISDIVLDGDLPERIRSAAEMYAGCISGAQQMDTYMGQIFRTGFQNISIQKKKPIVVPDDILKAYLSEDEIAVFRAQGDIIFSISVYGEKLALKEAKSCEPGSSCCS